MTTIHYTYMENTDGTSNKFYEVISLEDDYGRDLIGTRWGRIGHEGSSGNPLYGHTKASLKISEKEGKGYRIILDETYSVNYPLAERLRTAIKEVKPADIKRLIIEAQNEVQKKAKPEADPLDDLMDGWQWSSHSPELVSRITGMIPAVAEDPDRHFVAFQSLREELESMRKITETAVSQFEVLEAVMSARLNER